MLLLPDLDGRVEDSDWETFDGTARALGARLARWACLLYTSDAADERSSVALGGRRIIKKKTQPVKRTPSH